MNTIKFTLDDQFNERVVKFSTTLDGENIGHYVEAFAAFLLACGFDHETVNNRLNEFKDART